MLRFNRKENKSNRLQDVTDVWDMVTATINYVQKWWKLYKITR